MNVNFDNTLSLFLCVPYGFGHKVCTYGDMKRKNESEKRKAIRDRKMRRNVFVIFYLEQLQCEGTADRGIRGKVVETEQKAKVVMSKAHYKGT